MRVAAAAVLLVTAAGLVAPAAAAQVPRAAYEYRADLIRNARAVWGLNAPIALFAAQVHQESAWRPDAQSPYAGGLAQFTPDTADWISQVYPGELAANAPYNPAWALRALVRYDRHLWTRLDWAASGCDRAAFMLSAYNGGYGWVGRDRRLAAARGADDRRWWNHVERYSPRADWAFDENRGYPRRILLTLQPRYRDWGPAIDCTGAPSCSGG